MFDQVRRQFAPTLDQNGPELAGRVVQRHEFHVICGGLAMPHPPQMPRAQGDHVAVTETENGFSHENVLAAEDSGQQTLRGGRHVGR